MNALDATSAVETSNDLAALMPMYSHPLNHSRWIFVKRRLHYKFDLVLELMYQFDFDSLHLISFDSEDDVVFYSNMRLP